MHAIRQKIDKSGLSKPFIFAPANPFTATYRVTVPKDVHAVFGVKLTLDDLKNVPAAEVDWFPDEDFCEGVTESCGAALRDPLHAIAIDVAELSGPIYLTVIQADNFR